MPIIIFQSLIWTASERQKYARSHNLLSEKRRHSGYCLFSLLISAGHLFLTLAFDCQGFARMHTSYIRCHGNPWLDVAASYTSPFHLFFQKLYYKRFFSPPPIRMAFPLISLPKLIWDVSDLIWEHSTCKSRHSFIQSTVVSNNCLNPFGGASTSSRWMQSCSIRVLLTLWRSSGRLCRSASILAFLWPPPGHSTRPSPWSDHQRLHTEGLIIAAGTKQDEMSRNYAGHWSRSTHTQRFDHAVTTPDNCAMPSSPFDHNIKETEPNVFFFLSPPAYATPINTWWGIYVVVTFNRAWWSSMWLIARGYCRTCYCSK